MGLKAKHYEYDQKRWELDAESFERNREMLKTFKSKSARDIIIRTMNNIKARYPALKDEVIPTE